MARVRVDKTKQLVVLKRDLVRAARARLGVRLKELARTAGVGFGTMSRALNGQAVGVDLAARAVAALGLTLAEATANEDERRPAEGYSPEALAHFNRLLFLRIEEAFSVCHRVTAEEAKRRCWFWPTAQRIRSMISIKQTTPQGEGALSREVKPG